MKTKLTNVMRHKGCYTLLNDLFVCANKFIDYRLVFAVFVWNIH